MSKQTCSRCHVEEHIPTHQYVKFDAAIQWLCAECWELFRVWFFRGPKAIYQSEDKAA